MARTPTGLTDEQVVALRAALQGNKRPKVAVAGQQFGGKTVGQVVSVGEPETEGPEFIQVRVTLDGLTDVLRFAPKELRLPERARTPAARTPAARNPVARTGAPAVARTPRRAATPKPPAAAVNGAAQEQTTAGSAPAPARSASPPAAKPVVAAAAPAVEEPRRAVAAKPAARSRKAPVRPPTVTITITSSGTDWTVTANRGGKSLVKAVQLAPGVVAAAVQLLGEQAISTAVDEVNGAALSLAQQRADELRAELAAVESVLAAHRAPGR